MLCQYCLLLNLFFFFNTDKAAEASVRRLGRVPQLGRQDLLLQLQEREDSVGETVRMGLARRPRVQTRTLILFFFCSSSTFLNLFMLCVCVCVTK